VRLTWLSDIHMNFVADAVIDAFCCAVNQTLCDAVLIGGDVGEADSVHGYLLRLARKLDRPIYCVLGNHDFYGGEITEVRVAAKNLKRADGRIRWLPADGVVVLTGTTALVGHDGWADGRHADFLASTFRFADYELIDDLVGLDKIELQQRLMQLDEAARHVRSTLGEAVRWASEVVLLTHVPPFAEASWYQGRLSNDNSMPHFSCKAVGDTITEVMSKYPRTKLTVLCGHTHGGGECDPLPNVHVITGAARYGQPRVQRAIKVE